jgi:hypothetical protein
MIYEAYLSSSSKVAITAAVVAVITCFTAPAASQTDTARVARAIPAAVTPPMGYQRALDRGWRSEDGSPGNMWQQDTSYDIEGRLDTTTGELEGTVRIRYVNNAPATLPSVLIHLHQNIHKEGSPRNESVEITGGVTLTSVSANGQLLEEDSDEDGPGYEVRGTIMQLRTETPVEEGDTLQLEIGWEFSVPQKGAGERMGHSDREIYFIAYWFPKMVLLDDLVLWNADPFLGTSEFYYGFADYTAALSVPENWSVMATGTLDNPEEVYSAITLDRIAEAGASDDLVTIAGQPERDAGTVTASGTNGWLTYRFSADNVRDFAWTASNVQRWDATSALVPDRDDDGEDDRVLIHSFWREERAPLWAEEWQYAKQSIEFHSQYTGLSYPWPHMTSVEGEGIINGGMEFPMLTLMGGYEGQDGQALFSVTSHELGHMWVPMIVGTNEKQHAWMDEGATTYLENQSEIELWPGVDHHRIGAQGFIQTALTGQEQSMMRHGDWYEPGPGYGNASYWKPAALMVALREVMGREIWEEAYQTFISEWAYKHPTPWDFFATFERFAEEDLDWFWTAFYYETWTLDHAVREVRPLTGGGARIVIDDLGVAPFPATVRIRTSTRQDFTYEIPVDHWLAGNTTYEIEVEPGVGAVTRVEVDPSGYAPDIDRTNNFWPQG